jgi:hypothetical protein
VPEFCEGPRETKKAVSAFLGPEISEHTFFSSSFFYSMKSVTLPRSEDKALVRNALPSSVNCQ